MNTFQDKVVYQIYPKSFKDTNGDGIGDLRGIIEKLDYLQELGVDYIWLTPVYASPQNDNGYDISDYYSIEPMYGTMEDLDELVEKAKEKHIDIMLDMVFNHTSTSHVWFQKALANDPIYKDYYIFKKGKDKQTPPTNWVSKFGGNAWAYVDALDTYYLHLFDPTQADLNWDNPAVREELANVVKFWMGKGIKGFRFDVVNLISKPDVFEDDFIGDGRRFYTDGHHVHEYLRELNERSFGNAADFITVGEMSSTTMEACAKYAGANTHELSMVFSFHHLKVDYRNKEKWALQPMDFMELKNLFHAWQCGMQEADAWMASFWCNHDQPRAVSRFGDDQVYWKQSAKMLATATHMMRATPYIYQGEELGMTNAGFTSIDQYRDVESINYFKILKEQGLSEAEVYEILRQRSRDNARTPMQWNDQKHAGFTTGSPWISCVENYASINAQQQLEDQDSIFHHYQALIRLRKSYRVLQEGRYVPILKEHPEVYAYQRVLDGEQAFIFNNFYAHNQQITLPQAMDQAQVLIKNYEDVQISSTTLTLRPYESVVLYVKA